MRRERDRKTMSQESYGNCTKEINEECKLHPVDCDNCQNTRGCRMKTDFLAHPDKVKRCRFFVHAKGRLAFLGFR